LFRSSRPDYIETANPPADEAAYVDCSGLPGRTTLRRQTELLVDCGGNIVPVFQAGLH